MTQKVTAIRVRACFGCYAPLEHQPSGGFEQGSRLRCCSNAAKVPETQKRRDEMSCDLGELLCSAELRVAQQGGFLGSRLCLRRPRPLDGVGSWFAVIAARPRVLLPDTPRQVPPIRPAVRPHETAARLFPSLEGLGGPEFAYARKWAATPTIPQPLIPLVLQNDPLRPSNFGRCEPAPWV